MSTTIKNPELAWISVRHLQHMITRGEAVGLRMDELLEEAGFPTSRLADADGLVPMSVIEFMLSSLSRRYADPLLGLHLASDIQPATFGALGYILQACGTFGDVLDAGIRYNGLLSNIGTVSVVFGPGTVEVCWECSAGGYAFRRQATEYVLGGLVVLSRLLLPEHADIVKAVNFSHPRIENSERIREYFLFFHAPVYFDKRVSSVVLPASVLKMKLRHGDVFIKDLLEQHAQNLLRKRKQEFSLPEEVRHLIDAMLLDGAPTKDMIAAQLGMSGRSLHRKLQEMGSSYRKIMDQARFDIAHARLCDGNDTINEISEFLGFSSHQAFLRWFKQCTGKTPGEYRNKKQNDGALK
jgi:AraC-like DNA-binding protein